MISPSNIRSLAYDKTYKKGMQIFLLRDRIQIHKIHEAFPKPEQETIYAKVKGSSRQAYNVEIVYDRENDDVESASCDCPAFSSYPGICKHCVAVLLQYVADKQGTTRPAHIQTERLNTAETQSAKTQSADRRNMPQRAAAAPAINKPSTTYILKQLLDTQIEKKTAPILQRDVFGHVRIEPYLSFVNHYDHIETTVQFKIGAERMYVLKDIYEFSRNMKNSLRFSYGKKLEFTHVLESFEEESRPIAAFICAWAKDHNPIGTRQYYYASSTAKLRDMSLTGSELEQLLNATKDMSLEIDGIDQYHGRWHSTSVPPGINLYITGEDAGVSLALDEWPLIKGRNEYMYFAEGEIYRIPIKTLRPVEGILDCLARPNYNPSFIAEEDLPVFCRELLPKLKNLLLCHIENFDESVYGITEVSFKIYLDAPEKDVVTGKIQAVYGEKEYDVYDRRKDFELRDIPREIEVSTLISSYFDRLDEMKNLLVIDGDEDEIYAILTEGIDELQKLGEVYVSDSLKRFGIKSSPQVSVGVSLSGDLLELSLTAGDMSREDLVDILSKYNKRKKYYRLKNGDFIQIDDDGITTLAELREGLSLTAKQLAQESIALPKYRAIYLDSELRERSGIPVERNRDFKALIRDMKTVEDNDFEVPDSLTKVLREYQKRGFLWLKTLAHNGFGGILADDMGLGKTVQVIAYLLSEQEEKERTQWKPTLIICPSSLIYNWESELRRFAPDLTTRLIAGSAAERKEQIENIKNGDICITSYELLKRDIGAYKDIVFSNQFIDEAQYIKNHNTKAARSVKQITAGFKAALTGTPMENRLSELWSIFDFLMPGFLYTYEKFRKEVENPIVQGQDEAALQRLQKLTHPFILRRLKKDVLKDLPDKIEKNMFTRLEGEQQKLYDAHVKQLQLFLNGSSDEEFSTSKIQVLSQLTRLRQLCCDPALVYENYKGTSAKTAMCMELIANGVSAGHKILLFSQFTTMLADLEEKLEEEGISYYVLTGATSKEKRSQLVKDFNEDDTSVFLISLKAGGTGLNLTAADMVIHFDPWWNLAVQNQATDRAHRIGQKNVVTVYKLIAEDTIEDKIIELQERKKDLADQVLSGSGIGAASFSREELMELLR